MITWLLDTGPLVALLARDDAMHAWAVEQAKQAPPAVLTCDAVISEALFLLARAGHNPDELFAMAEVGFLRSSFDFNRERPAVRELMRRYAKLPMAFADACLVRMAELHPGAVIWTLDTHFHVYRQHRRQTLALVVPEKGFEK
jgi:predicted nucleic acid-binding protein